MNLTKEQLQYLEETFKRYEINTPLRKAHFMATCYHESQGFTRFIENLNYSESALRSLFSKYFSSSAIASKYARQPEKTANRIYANRMGNGNEASGDGWKYRGAGAIQLTGKENQTKYFEYRGLSLLPKLLQSFEFAIDSAGWFWKTKGCNELADKDDVIAVRKKVNGGVIGIDAVKILVSQYKQTYK